MDYLENQSRGNNLRIDGVEERQEETWADSEQALRKEGASGRRKRTSLNEPTATEGDRTLTVTEQLSSNSHASRRETLCEQPGLAASL